MLATTNSIQGDLCSIVQNPLPPSEPVAAVKGEKGAFLFCSVGNLVAGALGGYMAYWIQRGMIYIGLIKDNSSFSAIPNVLAGLAGAGIVESAKLAHFVALKIMGERESHEQIAQISLGGRLRSSAWKAVSSVENLEHRVDAFFSHLLGIRTRKQVQEEGISITNPVNLEVLRREFWCEVKETLCTAIPQELGVSLVQAFGYKVLGGHALVGIRAILFLTQLHQRIAAVYQLQEQALANLYCDQHSPLNKGFSTIQEVEEDEEEWILINLSKTALDKVESEEIQMSESSYASTSGR